MNPVAAQQRVPIRPISRATNTTEDIHQIVLPENPSERDLITYVDRIVASTEKANTRGVDDLPVKKLMAVGPDHINLLLDRCHDSYTQSAISRMIEPKHKDLFLSYLAECSDLACIVNEQGWQEEAKPILLDGLRKRPSYLHPCWIQAVALLEDTNTYADLKMYFLSTYHKQNALRIIQKLPGMDLSNEVARIWKQSKYDDASALSEIIPIALAYNHPDALTIAVQFLREGDLNDSHRRRIVQAIKDFTDAPTASDRQIIEWYEKNKTILVFDPMVKKFVYNNGNTP